MLGRGAANPKFETRNRKQGRRRIGKEDLSMTFECLDGGAQERL